MKYLGDSLPAARYADTNDTLYIQPTGDPTFLHPDFKRQPLFTFLKNSRKPIAIINMNWKENALAPGWAWDDYNDDYMAERSSLPVYGNVIKWMRVKWNMPGASNQKDTVLSYPPVKWKTTYTADTAPGVFIVRRNIAENAFEVFTGGEGNATQDIPFITNGVKSAIILLKDTLHMGITELTSDVNYKFSPFYAQPSDTLFRTMMLRSDNFFAEQVLLMVSNELLGCMDSKKIVDTILSANLKDIPQKPRWADGSGLSRYNLFSPLDFVYILNKMKDDFGFERLRNILPTGGMGTLKSYYLQDSGFIYAKTGTLSNVAALSGFLITKKGKLLVFSMLANNFVAPATLFRKASEKFLNYIRKRY